MSDLTFKEEIISQIPTLHYIWREERSAVLESTIQHATRKRTKKEKEDP